MSDLTTPEEKDRNAGGRSRSTLLKDAICALGMMIMLAHACLGIFLVPLYFLERRPESPLSNFIAYCHRHFGRYVFWSYFALLFGLFVWSLLRYANLPKRNRG